MFRRSFDFPAAAYDLGGQLYNRQVSAGISLDAYYSLCDKYAEFRSTVSSLCNRNLAQHIGIDRDSMDGRSF
jgi:hypothetical protein